MPGLARSQESVAGSCRSLLSASPLTKSFLAGSRSSWKAQRSDFSGIQCAAHGRSMSASSSTPQPGCGHRARTAGCCCRFDRCGPARGPQCLIASRYQYSLATKQCVNSVQQRSPPKSRTVGTQSHGPQRGEVESRSKLDVPVRVVNALTAHELKVLTDSVFCPSAKMWSNLSSLMASPRSQASFMRRLTQRFIRRRLQPQR